MNFEFNKIAGAVLGTALGVMVVGIVAETIYAPRISEQPGYVIAVAEPGEGEGEAPAEPQVASIADRLQTASPDDGAKDVAKCKTCHTFEQGGANKVGPNLWDVVGHNVIHGDFDYSDAMRAKGEEGMEWTFENLDHFIANPRGFIPGTAMSFAGVKNPEERADIIAYLRTLADNPVPLPPPTPAPTAEAPEAGGEQPPAETPPAAGENPPAATESPTAEEPAPPATEESAPPAAEEPAPAPETPPAEAPAPPATEQVPPPATEQPAPAPEPTPPAEDQPAAGQPDGAQTAPEPAPAPTETTPPAAEPAPAAPAPDAEADSPEGAPAAEPAQ